MLLWQWLSNRKGRARTQRLLEELSKFQWDTVGKHLRWPRTGQEGRESRHQVVAAFRRGRFCKCSHQERRSGCHCKTGKCLQRRRTRWDRNPDN